MTSYISSVATAVWPCNTPFPHFRFDGGLEQPEQSQKDLEFRLYKINSSIAYFFLPNFGAVGQYFFTMRYFGISLGVIMMAGYVCKWPYWLILGPFEEKWLIHEKQKCLKFA